MFGGWTTAVMLKAVALAGAGAGDGDTTPVSVTVNFISQVPPGDAALIETRRLGGGRSVSHWACETSGRAIDHLQLAYLADHRPHGGYYWSDGPRPSATLTVSIWFHAIDAELAEVGDDELLSEAFEPAARSRSPRSTSDCGDRGGCRLNSSVQAAWYR